MTAITLSKMELLRRAITPRRWACAICGQQTPREEGPLCWWCRAVEAEREADYCSEQNRLREESS